MAWGWNEQGQTNVPSGLRDVVAVAAGYEHSLAVTRSGEVVAWERNDEGQTNVPSGLRDVVAVAAGRSHSLVLTRSGEVVAWGSNEYGQTEVPSDLHDVVSVTGGEEHSLALTRSGEVVAWGRNDVGQTEVPALSKIVDDTLGGGTTTTSLVIAQIAAGRDFSVILTQENEIIVWGAYRSLPTTFNDITDIVQISVNYDNLIALRRDGTVVQGFFGDPTDVPLAIRAEL